MSKINPMDGALALVPFDAPEPFEIVAGEDVATLLARLLDQGRLLPDQIPFLSIWLNGEELDRGDALDWVLMDGDQVALVLVPQGGGEGKKDVGAILINLAILVVSVMTGRLELAITAAVNLTRALFTRIPEKSKGANESYALGGQSNNVRLDQPMPLILGLQTVYPDVAAQPYTQTVGDTVYLHVVYGLHYGPCAVSDIKIGGTELAQYGADVETQVITAAGPKSSPLYPSRVVQNSLTDTVDEAGTWEVATSALDADSLEVDLVWPSGLYRMSSSQVQKSLAITITIERRLVGSTPWTPWVNETLNMNTKDAVRRTWATSVAKGQYEVRLRRSAPPPANSGAIIDTVVWTALRTIENTPPVSDPNLSLLFCRFKASKELSGTLPLVSASVEPIAEIWTGSAWGSPQATSNPAALVRMLAMGPNAALPIAATEVGASLATFFTHCATNGFTAGLQVSGEVSLGDAMQATAACGHGAIWHDGSQLQCALEWTKPAPKALFDWRTASNWREERDWLGEIHGMRVAYRDASNNGAAGEVLVYADGYSAANASLFERIDMDRSMSPARAWREGRKALVRRINGGRSVSFRTPADGLDVSAVQFGARVAIVPPLLSLARASAAVENRIMAGGLVAGVRLDDDVEIVTGTTHGLRIGTPLRGVLAVQVAAAGGAIGWTRDLYFTSPMAPNDAPEAGDKVVFGVLGSEAQDYEIASLRPLSNFDVEVTATPYLGPLIAAVEGEVPPAGLQGALNTANSPLAAPRIDAATPNGEGGALVVFSLLPQRGNPIDAVTVRRRVQLAADGTDAVSWGQWEDLPTLAGAARMVTIPPPNMAAGGVSAQSRALAMEIQLAAVSRAATSLPTTASVSLTRQLIPEVAAQATAVPWTGVSGAGRPEDNATIGARVGANLFPPGNSSTPLPGTEVLNSQIGIDAAGRMTNTGAGSVIIDNTKISLTDGAVATVNNRVAIEESARASADAVLATRSTNLEAAARFPVPEALNKNPTFGSWTGALPDDWLDWSFGTTGITKATGDISSFAYRQVNPNGALNYGIFHALNGKMALGWHVLEAEITLNSGSLNGAAIHLNWGVSAVTNSDDIRFVSDPDITGAVVSIGVVGRRYRFSKLINITVVPNFANLYAMTTWTGVASSGNAKDLTWHKCLVRQASQGEIDAKVAKDTTIPNTIARIATEETARASADATLASRATALEAQMANTFGSGLQSRISIEESARASADAALASRSTVLEAAVRFPVPEAVNKNPTFSTWSGGSGSFPEDWGNWSNGAANTKEAGTISPFAYRQSHPSSNFEYGIQQSLDGKMTQGWYVMEADITLNSGALTGAGMYLHYGPAGSITNSHTMSFADGAQPDIDGVINGAGIAGRRYRYSKLVQLVNPAGSAQVFAMTHWPSYSPGNVAKDLTWHKALIRPATQGEIDAKVAKDTTIPNLTSRIATEESARASADAAQASQITTLTAKVDGNPNLFPYPQPITSRTPSQQGWLGNPVGTLYVATLGGMIYFRARAGGPVTTEVYYYDLPDAVAVATSLQYTLSASGYAGVAAAGDRLYMYLEVRSSDNSTLLHNTPGVTLNSGDLRTRYTQTTNFVGGYTVARLRLVFVREWPASGAYQDVVFSHIKLEAGPVATAFTNTSQVLQVASVSADAYGRAYAISGTELEVNGRKGGFVIDNNGLVVNFQITADDFRIYQSIGGAYTVPFRVVGGQTQINDALIRTLNVIPDGGGPSHRVQLRPNSVSGADGATFTFSSAYGGIPLIRPVILQPPALAAGESYDISATNLSPSGFTIRAKKFTAGTPTAQSSGAGSNVGGTPQWQAQKPTAVDADGNAYTFNWTATLARTSNEFMGGNQWYAEYNGEFDVYYNSGSGWAYAYTANLTFSSFYTGSSPSTVTGRVGSTNAILPALGQHGGAEFGLHATLGSITAFAGVSYTTTSQSSVVSLPGNFTFDIFAPT